MNTLICILIFVLGYVGYKYIYPWANETIEKKKIEGLNQYMGRLVLHIEKTESAYCYCWDFDFADISDNDYKKIMQYCIRHGLKIPAELLSNHTKKDISDLEQKDVSR